MHPITPHFTLEEMTRSQIAVRRGLSNTPSKFQMPILHGLCEEILEPAREMLGPIYVSSGYRSPRLNSLIGGATKSDHMIESNSAAADIIGLECDLGTLYRWVYIQLPWSKLIWEYGRWVHVSWCEVVPQIRTPRIKTAERNYESISIEEIFGLGR
jgi:hypothetical protein